MPGKVEIRREVRAWLASLGRSLREEWSASLRARLEALPEWRSAGTLLVFRPLPDEVDVLPAVEAALAVGRRAFAPRVVDAGLEFVRIDAATRWVRGRTPASEPERGDLCELTELVSPDALILVPAVAFSRQRDRLGRGAGNYDRTLAALAGRIRSVGVAFEGQLRDDLPVEPHDRRVDVVVTERRTLC